MLAAGPLSGPKGYQGQCHEVCACHGYVKGTYWVMDAAIVAATPPSQKGYGCFFTGPAAGIGRLVLADFVDDILVALEIVEREGVNAVGPYRG